MELNEKDVDIFVHAKTKIMNENEISYKIIGAAIEIHKTVGPGLLESAYENVLVFDLI